MADNAGPAAAVIHRRARGESLPDSTLPNSTLTVEGVPLDVFLKLSRITRA